MIRAADPSALHEIQSDDPFFTRVLSLSESYGDGYDFVGFWIQDTDGAVTAAVSRYEDKFSLWLTEGSDIEEIGAFLRFQGVGSVMFDSGFDIHLDDQARVISGDVMEYVGDDYISGLEIYEPDAKAYYELIESCANDIFIVPPYLMFLSDFAHRSGLDKLSLAAVKCDDMAASGVMTVSETDRAAILGAVATRPEYRRRGYSRELVRTIATRLRQKGRRVFVFSASESNTRFYINSGFTIAAGFKEIISV